MSTEDEERITQKFSNLKDILDKQKKMIEVLEDLTKFRDELKEPARFLINAIIMGMSATVVFTLLNDAEPLGDLMKSLREKFDNPQYKK